MNLTQPTPEEKKRMENENFNRVFRVLGVLIGIGLLCTGDGLLGAIGIGLAAVGILAK